MIIKYNHRFVCFNKKRDDDKHPNIKCGDDEFINLFNNIHSKKGQVKI